MKNKVVGVWQLESFLIENLQGEKDLESYTKHSIYHLTEKGIGGIFVAFTDLIFDSMAGSL